MTTPSPDKQHIVSQGDYTSAIAAQNGFPSHKAIWNHGSNASLKDRRKNPNILLPGDEMTIPPIELGSESRASEARHPFKVVTEKLKLRLQLLDECRAPIKDVKCRLQVERLAKELSTDGSGNVEIAIPRVARQGRILIDAPDIPLELDAGIGIGELDPLDEISGQAGRLNNLGYNAGALNTKPTDEGYAQFVSALEEFQCDHGLQVDGLCGPKTQSKLKEIHGC